MNSFSRSKERMKWEEARFWEKIKCNWIYKKQEMMNSRGILLEFWGGLGVEMGMNIQGKSRKIFQ